jgi:general secretion pathway protein A
MYLDHFGLREPPFSITPDPRFVFLSERHRDALAHLSYGIGQGGGSGFVQLTGEVGTGKTTISRLLLEQLPQTTRVALILNPLLSPVELLEAIGEELRIDLADRHGSVKALVDALNAYLLDAHATGLRVVLIIDEAQNLSAAALEQVRLLTNLETSTQKLLQIVLLGQPELREQLARPELRQLAQRITARYHLEPLDVDESEAYLMHRWAVAGGTQFPFARSAARRLHRHAGGVPRLLNVIAERALLAGYARSEQPIGDRLVDAAAAEVLAPQVRPSRLPWMLGTIMLLALTVVGLGYWRLESVPPQHAAARVAAKRPRAPTKVAAARAAAPQPVYARLDADTFAQRLAASDSNPQSAWTRLLALWSVHPDEIGSASALTCPTVLSPGVFCATGKARLSELAQFDRPALLKLHAGDHAVWVLMLGLDASQALLQLDGDTFTVHRGALEDALDGYATIWRGPQVLDPPLKHGDSGSGVDWLRLRLLPSRIPASASSDERTTTSSYDSELVAAVRGVQRDFGLHSDGVVGPETLLALMAANPSGPHLRGIPEQ